MNAIHQKHLPNLEKLLVPEFERELPFFSPINKSIIKCTENDDDIYRTLIVMNSVKYKHCFNIYKNMQVISSMEITSMVKGIQRYAFKLQELKKTLYCSVCDYQSQSFFLHEKSIIQFD